MYKNIFLLCFSTLILFTYNSCSVKWTKAITYGKTEAVDFEETLDFEIVNGLIIVPVEIGGKEYNFLFDSGAPFSISKEIQNSFQFKIISKGHIVDSDNNRKEVRYLQIDTIRIGSVAFLNQTAFEGDFKNNPILDCMNIDGIIGSNLMRHANWTIDQQQKKLTLSSAVSEQIKKEATTIPFKTDFQYNPFLDVNIGSALVKNILIDYGSNGPVALSEEIFSILKQRALIDDIFSEKGFQQSGIIGKTVPLNRSIAFSDEVIFKELAIEDVELRTGSFTLIGNKVLSRFVVTIDWDDQQLHLRKNEVAEGNRKTFGFRIGYTDVQGFYVQSVIEKTIAYQQGIRPGMKVLKLGELDFAHHHNFCDYLSFINNAPEKMIIEVLDEDGVKSVFDIEKTLLGRK